jgi:hypothetical protein
METFAVRNVSGAGAGAEGAGAVAVAGGSGGGLAVLEDGELLGLVRSEPAGSGRRSAACELLVARHRQLVRSCVRRYLRGPEPAEDLMQVGYVGLPVATLSDGLSLVEDDYLSCPTAEICIAPAGGLRLVATLDGEARWNIRRVPAPEAPPGRPSTRCPARQQRTAWCTSRITGRAHSSPRSTAARPGPRQRRSRRARRNTSVCCAATCSAIASDWSRLARILTTG